MTAPTPWNSSAWGEVQRVTEGLYLVDGEWHLHPDEYLEARGVRASRGNVARLVRAYRKAARAADPPRPVRVYRREE